MVATRKSVMLDMSAPQGKCPPKGVYTLVFDRVDDFGLSKPYMDEEPKLQFTLVFVLQYEDGEEEDDQFDGMEIKAWYTPKFKAIPGKIVPKLVTLLEALNGGTYECPEGQFDGWDELEKFTGRRIQSAIAPSASGWARLKGDPMPLKKGKKAPSIAVVVLDDMDDADASIEKF
jgi:hypothetical protein